jgi:hypothetical protein
MISVFIIEQVEDIGQTHLNSQSQTAAATATDTSSSSSNGDAMSLDSVFLTDVKDTDTTAATIAMITTTSTASSSRSSELSAAGAYCLALLPEVRYIFNYLNMQVCVLIWVRYTGV